MMNEQLKDKIALDVLRTYAANPGLRAHMEQMKRQLASASPQVIEFQHPDHWLRYIGFGARAVVQARAERFKRQLYRSGGPFAYGARAPTAASKVDTAARTVDLSFSSETPVQRDLGPEVLSHAKGAADMSRLNNGAPLLFNHKMDDVIGVVQGAHIGGDRRGHATVRFAKTPRGQDVMDMVQDGILKNVSFMYSVDEVLEDQKSGGYIATKWTPMEISVVTVPADNTVGIGRSAS